MRFEGEGDAVHIYLRRLWHRRQVALVVLGAPERVCAPEGDAHEEVDELEEVELRVGGRRVVLQPLGDRLGDRVPWKLLLGAWRE